MSVCQRRNTELLIQIDARKASWSGTKVCEITALEIVFTAHCYLSQLLEPRSSKWGNGLRSGGGRNNKQTTWQRRPSTVADASRNALRFRPWCLQGRNIFNILRMRWAFCFNLCQRHLLTLQMKGYLFLHALQFSLTRCFDVLIQHVFPVRLAKYSSLASEQNSPQLWSVTHCKLSSYTGHTLYTYQVDF